jgi:hypothetical protein
MDHPVRDRVADENHTTPALRATPPLERRGIQSLPLL